jgi:hypothetical protein
LDGAGTLAVPVATTGFVTAIAPGAEAVAAGAGISPPGGAETVTVTVTGPAIGRPAFGIPAAGLFVTVVVYVDTPPVVIVVVKVIVTGVGEVAAAATAVCGEPGTCVTVTVTG